MATTASPSDMEARIQLLEKQMAGLLATVNSFYDKYGMKGWGVPRPDQYLQPEVIDVPNKKSESTITVKPKKMQPIASQVISAPAKDLSILQQFQYSALNAKNSEVRLLKIATSKSADEPISCEMVVESLPDSPYSRKFPFFMPLSYTWGSPKKTEWIELNGKSFLVTKNLHIALKHFRNASSRDILPHGYSSISQHYWWIDAICINQDDLDERKKQVALMTRLYRLARVAHVWLGEEGGDSARAMRVIRELSQEISEQEQTDFIKTPSGQTHQYRGPGTVPEKIPDAHIYPEAKKKLNYRALIQLYRRDWWSRVWILQEVALPGEVLVHCGDEVCSWAQMMKVTSLLVHVVDEHQLPMFQSSETIERNSVASIFQRAELLSRLRTTVQGKLYIKDTRKSSPYLSLLNALLYAKNCEATDQQDKVYAILPLVSPIATTLAADYSKTKVEVYKATALDLARRNLDFLSLCQYVEAGSKDLPSWVPNFSQQWTYYPMLATKLPKGGKDDEEEPYLAEYGASDGSLKVQAKILDTLANFQDPGITAQSTKAEVKSGREAWEAFVDQKDVDRNVTHLEDVLRWYTSGVGLSLYYPLYKVGYTGEYGEEYDGSLRIFGHQLAPQVEKYEMNRKDKLGWYRNFFVGRQFVLSTTGYAGVAPAAAKPGDKLCKLNGSDILFILRKGTDGRWTVIGDCYFNDSYSAYRVANMRPTPKTQDIILC